MPAVSTPRIILAAILGLGVFQGLCGCERRGPVIRIGFVGPLTGDQATIGGSTLSGAKLAVAQANARGEILPGFTLELVALDDQHSPTQSVAAAKKLVADPDVVAVVGHLNSSCTMPASAVYHQAQMLQVTPVSSNPQITRQGFNTIRRVCATDDLQGPAAALFAVRELGARRPFIIDDMTTYGRGLAREFETKLEALGVTPLGHEGITQGDKDFTALLTKVKAAGPDLVYFAGMYPEGALLIRQRAELGLTAHFLGGDGLYDPVLIQLATPQAAEGVYLTTIGSDVRHIPSAQSFVSAYEAQYGPVGVFPAYAYEATNLVIWAIRQAGAKDRHAILAAMARLKDYPGIFGPQNFDARGDSTIHDIGIFIVKGGVFAFLKSAAWQ